MYSVKLSAAAIRDYKKLPQTEIPRINKAISGFASNPRPQGYKKLKDRDAFRLRVGDYRIIYEIHVTEIVVFVIRIRHRKEVYQGL